MRDIKALKYIKKLNSLIRESNLYLNWYNLKWLLGNLIETDGLNWIKLEIENLGLTEWIVKCKELNEYPMI